MKHFPPPLPKRLRPHSVSTISDVSTGANTNETVLKSGTIPANLFSRLHKRVRIHAWGTTGATANNKTPRLRVGPVSLAGTICFTKTNAFNARQWDLVVEIYRTGVDAQYSVAVWNAFSSNVVEIADVQRTVLALDDASALLVELTAQNAVAAAGDFTCSGLAIDVVDAP